MFPGNLLSCTSYARTQVRGRWLDEWWQNKAQGFDFRDIALPVHYLLSIIDCIK